MVEGGTPRNVIVPLNFNVWTGNTNAVPEPASALLALCALPLLRRCRRTRLPAGGQG